MAGSINRNAEVTNTGISPDIVRAENPLLWCRPLLNSNEIDESLLQRQLATFSPQSLFLDIPFTRDHHQYHQGNIIVTRQYSLAAYYVDALCKELNWYGQHYADESSRTEPQVLQQLSIGGATPTFLLADDLARILACVDNFFTLSSDDARRYTIKIDAKTFNLDIAYAVRELGFNRVIFYVEDFSPDVQMLLNRKYSVQKIESCFALAKRAGIKAIDVELVYGLPAQTRTSFLTTLQQLARLEPSNVSLHQYNPNNGSYGLNNDDAPALTRQEVQQMQTAATEFWKNRNYYPKRSNSFEQYRSTQYSWPLANKHLGLGLAATSNIGNLVWQNQPDLRSYIRQVNRTGNAWCWGAALDRDEQILHFVTQRLFNHCKVNKAEFRQLWELDFDQFFATQLQTLQSLCDNQTFINNTTDFYLTETGRWQAAEVAAALNSLKIKH